MKVKVAQSCPALQPHGLYSPCNSVGQNTGVGSLSLLQGGLPNLGIKPRSPALQEDSSPAEPQGESIDIFTATLLLIIAKKWKQLKYPSTDEWINQDNTYTQWNTTWPIKRNKRLIHPMALLNLK